MKTEIDVVYDLMQQACREAGGRADDSYVLVAKNPDGEWQIVPREVEENVEILHADTEGMIMVWGNGRVGIMH